MLSVGCLRALDFFEDCRTRGFPSVRDGLEIVVREMDIDGGDQLLDAGKAAVANDVVGKLAKEALNQVQPR